MPNSKCPKCGRLWNAGDFSPTALYCRPCTHERYLISRAAAGNAKRRCSKCQKVKLGAAFSKMASYCRDCAREYQRNRLKDFDLWIHKVWYHAKRRAKVQGIGFNLTDGYLKSIYPTDGVCPVYGRPMIAGAVGAGNPDAASLDRLAPSDGYIQGNVAFISNRANILKSDATADELRAIANWLDNFRRIQ